MRRSKSTEEPQEKPSKPELVPQPHGGAIYRGGVPGNKGGASLRKGIRTRLEDTVLAALDRIDTHLELDKGGLDMAVLTRLADMACKYTVGQRVVIEQIDASRFESLVVETAPFFEGREQEFEEWFQTATRILLPQSSELGVLDDESPEDE